jgi:Tol biopolymer transport system component
MVMGTNTSSAWSPDGQQVAYVSLQGMVDLRTLAIRDMRSNQPRELRLPLAFFMAPRWSPDGRTILVRGNDRQLREGLFAVDVATGETRLAVRYPSDIVRSTAFEWSPDGRAVWHDKPEARAIVRHDLLTGQEQPVIPYDGTPIRRVQQHPGLRISPDGRSIAFTGVTFDNNTGGTVVRIQTLEGDSLDIARAMHPEVVELQDWLPDGAGVLIMKRHRGDDRHELVEVRLNGAERSLGIMSNIRDVHLRHDGAALTYTSGMSSHEVWVHERFLNGSTALKGVQ